MSLQIESQPFIFEQSLSAVSLSGTHYGDGSRLTGITTVVNGTANQINTSKTGTTVTLSLPSSAVFPGNVSIIGNLTIAGSATYIDTKNLVVGDNIIYFNDNNYGSNVLDMGIVSHFSQAPLGYNHTGLIRRAGQGNPGVWTLFSGLTTEPASATNIDWNDKNIVIDTLSANLIGNLSGSYVTVGTGNSNQWNTAYTITTSYQSSSGSFATNSSLQSASALLTPLTLTNTLTGQLVKNTDINTVSGNWNTGYASTTALNLSSGSWNSVYSYVKSTSATNNPTYNANNYLCINSNVYTKDTYLDIVGGCYNNVQSYQSNCAPGTYGASSILGGVCNRICSNCSTIVGGGSNLICSDQTYGEARHSFIGGGFLNKIVYASQCSSIVGGYCNCVYQGSVSFIGGGLSNTASNIYSNIVGGRCNTASGAYSSVINGGLNNAAGYFSSVTSGTGNTASGVYSSVINGCINKICVTGTGASYAAYTSVINGANNVISSTSSGYYNTGTCQCVQSTAITDKSSILGGNSNCIFEISLNYGSSTSSAYSTIVNGLSGVIGNSSSYSNILNGSYNCIIVGSNSSILNGCYNSVTNSYSTILNGLSSNVAAYNSLIGSGQNNCILASACGSSIFGGFNNTASACYSMITTGSYNTTNSNYANIFGGINNTTSNNTTTAPTTLLHFDRYNQTSFIDSSISNASWAYKGDINFISSSSKFGKYAANFTGLSFIQGSGAATNLNFGTADFSFDFWFNCGNNITGDLIGNSSTGNAIQSPHLYLNGGNQIVYRIADSGGNLITVSYTPNQWNHIALTRISGTTYIFLNGANAGSVSDSTNFSSVSYYIRIGAGFGPNGNPNLKYTGLIDEFRMFRGYSPYSPYISTGFTVPVGPYVIGGSNIIGSQYSTVVGDQLNIIGGSNNSLSGSNSFILGSNIVSNVSNYTFVNNLSTQGTIAATTLRLNTAPTSFVNPVTATGNFLIVNVNGTNQAIQLWNYSS